MPQKWVLVKKMIRKFTAMFLIEYRYCCKETQRLLILIALELIITQNKASIRTGACIIPCFIMYIYFSFRWIVVMSIMRTKAVRDLYIMVPCENANSFRQGKWKTLDYKRLGEGPILEELIFEVIASLKIYCCIQHSLYSSKCSISWTIYIFISIHWVNSLSLLSVVLSAITHFNKSSLSHFKLLTGKNKQTSLTRFLHPNQLDTATILFLAMYETIAKNAIGTDRNRYISSNATCWLAFLEAGK